MTNKEILQASLLDIIFENRNKEYGAYALRNHYANRLLKALSMGLGLVLLFVVFNFMKFESTASFNREDNSGEFTVRNYVIPVEERQPPLPQSKPRPGQIANVAPTIVDDDKANDKMPEQDDLIDREISTITTAGDPPGDPSPVDPPSTGDGAGGETKQPEPQAPRIKIAYRAPQYPGGNEALIAFMQRNLITPEELEIGEKKVVRVKFLVDADGRITDVTVIESPGKDYDKEVTRVLKKMPRWEPAIQNDVNVAVSFVLPVTFITVEE